MSAKLQPKNQDKKPDSFDSLESLALDLRHRLQEKRCILLYAYNGTGKTRLSMAFKDAGKRGDTRDTLYFNAYTQDLFIWDNDLDTDWQRVLKINKDSRFFAGLESMEMDTRIRPFLHSYVDFDFRIDTEKWEVVFSRQVRGVEVDHIKVSRGEENIFIWCFFLAIVQLVLDGADDYQWVKYIYIDDPISSLDDNNAIAVAHRLAALLNQRSSPLKVLISSHHPLFFNVLHNEFEAGRKRDVGAYFLSQPKGTANYTLIYTSDTPFFHHVALLRDLQQAAQSGELYTYHFSLLRSVLEKSAHFHGFKNFSACIKHVEKSDEDDPDSILHARFINVLSHGNYSLFEPREMLPENKEYFRKILGKLLDIYPFNPEFLGPTVEDTTAS